MDWGKFWKWLALVGGVSWVILAVIALVDPGAEFYRLTKFFGFLMAGVYLLDAYRKEGP